MSFNQPRNHLDKNNDSDSDLESSKYQGQRALSRYIKTLENPANTIYGADYEEGTPGEKYILKIQKLYKDLTHYPAVGSKLAEFMESGMSLSHANYSHVSGVIEKLENFFEANKPKVDYIDLDTSSYEFKGDDRMKDQLGYIPLMKLKALGPATTSMLDMNYQTYIDIVKNAGGVSKQTLAVKMDKLARGKKINIDLRMANQENANQICREIIEEYRIYALRIRDIIKDSEYSFHVITGRDMRVNEFDVMISNLNQYVAKFEEIKDEMMSENVRMSQLGNKPKLMEKQKVEDLVSLVKKSKEFATQNDIYRTLTNAENKRFNTKNDGTLTKKPYSEEFGTKSEVTEIIKEISNKIDKCQDFLLEIGESDFSKNFINENKVVSNSRQTQNNPNATNSVNQNVQSTSNQRVTNLPKIESNSESQSSIPNFNKPKSNIENKVETVENIDQFVTKYFKDFDAFLVSEISKAKINNEDVLKFTGQDHKQEGVKNGYTKVPIQGLSKFELQTIGKIAEKYNTVEGVQIWIGNGQIGIMSASGEMLELLS
jgi:hypothetical protein